MKRLFLMIVLVMLVYMVATSHRRLQRPAVAPPAHWPAVRHRHDGNAGNRFVAEARERGRPDEVRQALMRPGTRSARLLMRCGTRFTRPSMATTIRGPDRILRD